jgi:hypothetical protein
VTREPRKNTAASIRARLLSLAQSKREWNAFVSRLNPGDKAPSLEEVDAVLRSFLLPCVSGDSLTQANNHLWTPNLNWSKESDGTKN